jgi:hypothetical protein
MMMIISMIVILIIITIMIIGSTHIKLAQLNYKDQYEQVRKFIY